MKIGISCNRYGAGGGLERYVRDLAAGFALLDDVRSIVFAPRVDESFVAEGVEAVELPARHWPRPLRALVLSRQIARRRDQVDVLIACNRVRGADIAVCGGTHLGYLEGAGRPARFKDRLEIRREQAHYADAKLIVAHSLFMRHELERLYGIASDRIVTLYPPVDTQRFSAVDDARRAALRERFDFGDRPVFLFASTGHLRKGLDPVVEAIERRQDDALLVVAGRPTNRRSRRLRELGYRNDIEDLYRAADFTVLAPDYEPFGLVAIESVLCGTPVVFAEGAGSLEVIEADAVRRFDRAVPASLEAALDAAISAWRAGASRLAAPRACLRYVPDVDTHVQAMRRLCEQVA